MQATNPSFTHGSNLYKREACTLGIQAEVSFLPCVSAEQKTKLLAECLCVLYTPENEHFGIVPLEAMAAGRPVLACKSGGPVESIIDRITGFTCDPCPKVCIVYPCRVLFH